MHIQEVIVFDDGDKEQKLQLDVRYPVKYFNVGNMTIGKKRNLMLKKCVTKYAVFMDTDDIYLPTYISHAISLFDKKTKIVGSADMLFYFTNVNRFDVMNCEK